MTEASLGTGTPLPASSPKARLKDTAFRWILFASIAIAIITLIILLVDIFMKGQPRLNVDLFQRFASSLPERAGARAAIAGTLWVMGVTAVLCIPVGVAAAVYLEEFADKDRWYNRLLELNIQNLAAVPSIVYGILGLAFVVRGFLGLGRTVLAGGLTLALLVLPIVVIASREALRSVPGSIRQAALALGATPWQAVSRQVLPIAVPGIATGSILALSRAIGEAAPLLLVSGLTFITFTPTGPNSEFTVLPLQIFNWTSRPQEEFKVVAAAATVVLLGILLLMNSFAIWLRNRYQTRW